jgi:quinoprotein glucose dehydrogenase
MIYRDLFITGFRTAESEPAYPGDIRAYDVRSGKVVWTFHTLPRPGETGSDTWPEGRTTGAANSWAGLAIDETRGIVYAPTGSAVSDFYGANRAGANLFANSLVALDASTGKRLWHFQAVHHDILDRDFPSPPLLATIQKDGRPLDVVAQPSKQGWLYVFNRVTGEPLWPIEERKVPASDVPGESAWPTQPHVTKPAPFARQTLTEDMLTAITPEDHQAALEQFRTFRNEGPFTPLALGRNTVVFPGFDGGAEWGGSAFDPRTGVMYINANDLAWTSMMRAGRGGGYTFGGYNRWMINGHPGVAPPWGTLNAIDLATGEYRWKIPLGEYPDLVAKGIRNTGSQNYGGPIVTAGGLVFIGATIEDRKFHAFDSATGKLLWETTLPGTGRATPATYRINGKQYVVITVTGAASFMMAFSL